MNWRRQLIAWLLPVLLLVSCPPSAAWAAVTDDLPALFDRALALSRQGDPVQALPIWDQVLDLAPRDAAAWSNRGNVRLMLGDPEGAIADQTRSIELAPDDADPI